MPLPSAILETCLYVDDLALAKKFYTDIFEYEILQEDGRFIVFKISDLQLLLIFTRGSDPHGTQLPFGFIPKHSSTGSHHLGFRVPTESLDAWLERLAKFNVTIESRFQWPRGGESVYFRDPDGNFLELLTPGVWPCY